MKRKNIITIEILGERSTHIPDAQGNYATWCGLDGEDNAKDIGQETVETAPGAKVDCDVCRSMWEEAMRWKRSDFARKDGQ